MKIIVDTREQQPLEFEKGLKNFNGVSRETLRVGDYAVRFNDGHVPLVRVERKSLGDLYGTMSKGYKRFRKEINRAIDAGIFFYLFIEVPLKEVRKGCKYKKGGKLVKVDRNSEELIQQINTLEADKRLIHKCFTDRKEMAYAVYKLFYSYGVVYSKSKKKCEWDKKLKSKTK